MARLQQWILAREAPPTVHTTRIDEAGMERRMGATIAAQCLAEHRKKALDDAGAARLNAVLREIWPSLRRSEEHTSELQSLMRISYAVFCLKKKKSQKPISTKHYTMLW